MSVAECLGVPDLCACCRGVGVPDLCVQEERAPHPGEEEEQAL